MARLQVNMGLWRGAPTLDILVTIAAQGAARALQVSRGQNSFKLDETFVWFAVFAESSKQKPTDKNFADVVFDLCAKP